MQFVLRFYEDGVEYGEGVLPAVDTTAGGEVIHFGQVEDFVKRHRDGFPDDFSILSADAQVSCDADLQRLVEEALEKKEKQVVLRVVSSSSDWEMIDTASQFSNAPKVAQTVQVDKEKEAEGEGEEDDKVEENAREGEEEVANDEPKEVEEEGEEALEEGKESVEKVEEVVSMEGGEATAVENELSEEVKDDVEQSQEAAEGERDEEVALAVAEQATAQSLPSTEDGTDPSATEEPVESTTASEAIQTLSPIVDDLSNQSAKECEAKDTAFPPPTDGGETAKMASDGFFVDSDPSLSLDILDDCWSRSTFAMSKHCQAKPSLAGSHRTDSSAFLNAQTAAPAQLQELISLLRGVAEELLDSDPEKAANKLSELLSETNSTLVSCLANLAADEKVVRSVQEAIGSEAVKNLVVDLGRNEVATWAQVKEILNAHLGDLFAVCGDLLKRSPQLVSIIPHCLKHLTGFLEAEEEETGEVEEQKCSAEEKAFHPGILCDGCDEEERKEASTAQGFNVNGYIQGIRYKSAVKVNYDLCESCEASGDFDEDYGPFLKIRTPSKAPKEIVCVLDHSSPPPPASTPTTPNTSGGQSQATGAANVLLCPKKGHPLSSFTVPNRLFACDVCDCRPQRGSVMHGCRECDWDICETCLPQQRSRLFSAAVQPAAAPTAAPPNMTVVSPPTSGRPRMAFVKDLNLMDGSIVVAGSSFTKLWRVKNSSASMTWPSGCRLVCVGGDLMGASPQGYLVPPVPPKQALDLVVKFVAPRKSGRYLSYWRLITPTNQRFGQRLWIDVFVEEEAQHGDENEAANGAAGMKWAKELQQLADMDFLDVERNVELLAAHGGKVEQVIAALLAE